MAATSSQAALTCSPRESARNPSAPAPATATSDQPSTEATRLGGRVETTEVDMRANLRAGRARVNTVALAPARRTRRLRSFRARRLPFAHFHHPAVRTLPRLLWCVPLLLGCAGKPAAQTPTPAPAATPVVRPFAALAEQRVIVAPAARISEADPTGWLAQIPRTRESLRSLDDAIGAT